MRLFYDTVFNHPALAGRRSFFLEHTYTDIEYAEDYLLWTKTVGTVYHWRMNETLTYYRIHATQSLHKLRSRERFLSRHIRIPYLEQLTGKTFRAEDALIEGLFDESSHSSKRSLRQTSDLVRTLRRSGQSRSTPLWNRLLDQKYASFLGRQKVLQGASLKGWFQLILRSPGYAAAFLRWLARPLKR